MLRAAVLCALVGVAHVASADHSADDQVVAITDSGTANDTVSEGFRGISAERLREVREVFDWLDAQAPPPDSKVMRDALNQIREKLEVPTFDAKIEHGKREEGAGLLTRDGEEHPSVQKQFKWSAEFDAPPLGDLSRAFCRSDETLGLIESRLQQVSELVDKVDNGVDMARLQGINVLDALLRSCAPDRVRALSALVLSRAASNNDIVAQVALKQGVIADAIESMKQASVSHWHRHLRLLNTVSELAMDQLSELPNLGELTDFVTRIVPQRVRLFVQDSLQHRESEKEPSQGDSSQGDPSQGDPAVKRVLLAVVRLLKTLADADLLRNIDSVEQLLPLSLEQFQLLCGQYLPVFTCADLAQTAAEFLTVLEDKRLALLDSAFLHQIDQWRQHLLHVAEQVDASQDDEILAALDALRALLENRNRAGTSNNDHSDKQEL